MNLLIILSLIFSLLISYDSKSQDGVKSHSTIVEPTPSEEADELSDDRLRNKNRIKIAQDFCQALKLGKLENEEIVKKFMQHESYFKGGSLKKHLADFHLNEYRIAIKKAKSFNVIEYVKHKNDFVVVGVRDIGDNSDEPVYNKFTLFCANGTNAAVNEKDIYIIKLNDETESGNIFLLFDSKNKILGLNTFSTDGYISLMQF